jgi:hypothetical protein
MSTTHLLRVEGVNLANFVFDTRDLSTARGGSLLLLDAIPVLIKTLKSKLGEDKVRVLSQGASSGLFELETSDPTGEAEAVQQLLAGGNWSHATFVVDVLPKTTAFREDFEGLLAANRWRQMQAAALAVPDVYSAADLADPPACEMDGLRPALKRNAGPTRDNGEQTHLSSATRARREYGCKAKQSFYAKVIKGEKKEQDLLPGEKALLNGLPELFAQDFSNIALDTGPLPHKLAVFYADGNAFGSIQTKHCTTPEQQIAWDTFIRGTRRDFLIKFLSEEIVGRKGEWQTNGIARFETLLWGGDEFMFVMPANLGWHFATLFFCCFNGLNLSTAGEGLPSQVLTHTASLVFCHHRAPIARIKRLAKDQMAEFAKDLKDDQKEPIGRSRDQLLVVALESFDHLGNSYESAMNHRYGNKAGVRVLNLADMVLAGPAGGPGKALHEVLRTLATSIEHLRSGGSEFARSQLRGLVNAIVKSQDPAAAAALAAFPLNKDNKPTLPHAFRNATENDEQIILSNLHPLFPSDTALWFQLEELLDYARP